MRSAEKITELVDFVINDTKNVHKEVEIGKITKRSSSFIYKTLKINIRRSVIIIDSSGIRHTMRKHSNSLKESNSGQVAVSYNDFKLLPKILSLPGKIEYKGKNALKQDVFIFIKQLENLYLVAMCIRPSKHGIKVVYATMYIKKTKKPA